MRSGQSCPVLPHTPYSEDPNSAFFADAMQVYTVSKTLTDEQKLIARFWSDDPMMSPTPPGHWISIALQIIDRDAIDGLRSTDLLARLGIALADSFIGNWADKYKYDLLRPVTYINRHIDPAWQPLLITPPFPEHPSGHSTQSGAAAAALTAFFGEGFAFSDNTHEADGMPTRHYPDFWAAAEEAAISRLYGGIHFAPANQLGLEQGRCIGAHAAALVTVS
jgi:membrane-associated phospholipid phosphatase